MVCFTHVFRVGGVFKRIDLAINDKVGILDIPAHIRKCHHDESISFLRSFKNYRFAELAQREEKRDIGNYEIHSPELNRKFL